MENYMVWKQTQRFDWKPPLNDKHHGLNEMLHVLSKISMIKLKTPWLNANLSGLNEKDG